MEELVLMSSVSIASLIPLLTELLSSQLKERFRHDMSLCFQRYECYGTSIHSRNNI